MFNYVYFTNRLPNFHRMFCKASRAFQELALQKRSLLQLISHFTRPQLIHTHRKKEEKKSKTSKGIKRVSQSASKHISNKSTDLSLKIHIFILQVQNTVHQTISKEKKSDSLSRHLPVNH